MKTPRLRRLANADFYTERGITSPHHSHSIVSEAMKPALILAFLVVIAHFYRHLYRQKTSAFAGAGDGLGLRGGYSSSSIVNYRCEPDSPKLWII